MSETHDHAPQSMAQCFTMLDIAPYGTTFTLNGAETVFVGQTTIA